MLRTVQIWMEIGISLFRGSLALGSPKSSFMELYGPLRQVVKYSYYVRRALLFTVIATVSLRVSTLLWRLSIVLFAYIGSRIWSFNTALLHAFVAMTSS